MELLVMISHDDIKKGQRHNCMGCPVWRAIRRAMQHMPDAVITVTRTTAYINGKQVALPEDIQAFIDAVDAGWKKYLKPVSFKLVLP